MAYVLNISEGCVDPITREPGQVITMSDAQVWFHPYSGASPFCTLKPEGFFVMAGDKVCVSKEQIANFNRVWPCSELRQTRAYWFQFDGKNGDLIDTDCPHSDDGSAASALADDCKQFLFDGVVPSWVR